MNYKQTGHETYGTKCEWEGCGWDEAGCDVHHISYQEHNRLESKMRAAIGQGDMEKFARLCAEARKQGFMEYKRMARQLDKDDRSTNLTVLCPNHHRLVHVQDMGLDVLKRIPPRK